MLLPQDWERVAQERQHSWDADVRQRQLLALLPSQPPVWRRWTSISLVWIGAWMVRWGEAVMQREYRRGVSAVG
jgi:hypothetical protein